MIEALLLNDQNISRNTQIMKKRMKHITPKKKKITNTNVKFVLEKVFIIQYITT